MEWSKARVHTNAFGAEIVTALLMENNIVGVEIINVQERVRHLTEVAHSWDYAEEGLLDAESDDVYVVFYVTKDESGSKLLGDVAEGLAGLRAKSEEFAAGLGTLEMATEFADDETWLHEWKKHFKPFRVGDVVIVPSWEEYQPQREREIVFRIDPGTAFGTGQHQTTRLCISALQKYLCTGERVLDIGCGSGILAIIALLLGAENVLACDIDPAGAIAATKKNTVLNGIDTNRIRIFAGDALSCEKLRAEICRDKYEVIVANIVADVVIGLVPFVRGLLAEGGVFIACGIIDERTVEVLAAFVRNNMQIVKIQELEGWVCVVGSANEGA